MGSLRSSEEDPSFHLGQRLSYDSALCTIRYYGTLPSTKGVWLGVEWDDVDRGKHDGTYQGTKYFHCLSSAPTAGSFIRPSRTPDLLRSFLDALRFKYAAGDTSRSGFTISNAESGASIPNGNVIEISGKVVEEVGFERIRQQQAVLQNLRIVLLDGLCVLGITLDRHDPNARVAAQEAVAQTCPDLFELDLGWNLLETWADVAEICLPLKKLQVLKVRYGLDTCAKLSSRLNTNVG
jgi:tubulin-specific chaperone E